MSSRVQPTSIKPLFLWASVPQAFSLFLILTASTAVFLLLATTSAVVRFLVSTSSNTIHMSHAAVDASLVSCYHLGLMLTVEGTGMYGCI